MAQQEIVKAFYAILSRYRRDYGNVDLPAGTADEDLHALERETSLVLPADLRALLLVHDGAPMIPLRPDGAWLCSAAEMLETVCVARGRVQRRLAA